MDLITYLRVFRRRWILLVGPLLGALVVAWATLPESQDSLPVAPSYSSTATLIYSPQLDATDTSLQTAQLGLSTVALYATVGDIPKIAAKRLGFNGEPQLLASQVSVSSKPETDAITISTSDQKPKVASARTNAFARATVRYFKKRADLEAKGKIEATKRELRSLAKQIREVGPTFEGTPEDQVAQAQRQSLNQQYAAQFSRLSELNRELGSPGPVSILQPGVAIPQETEGFAAPSNPLVRLSIAALLGLLLGAALALLIERVDSRLRTREQVEDSFGLPVLAEIPSLPIDRSSTPRIVSADMPASATAEAYRNLRSAVLLLGPSAPSKQGATAGSSLVALVTSALPKEGKTTTVANLATVLAEAGRRVLVLSLDLRDPRIHEYFDVENGTGVSDLLAANRGEQLAQVVRDTSVPGVQIVTSGERLDHPGALLASVGPMIAAARELADVVLLDCAPMLSVSDAVDLARHIDLALLVSRLNKATTSQAAAAQRLLSRLAVPALGTVLVGAPRGAVDLYRFRAPAEQTVEPVERTDAVPATMVNPSGVDQSPGTERE